MSDYGLSQSFSKQKKVGKNRESCLKLMSGSLNGKVIRFCWIRNSKCHGIQFHSDNLGQECSNFKSPFCCVSTPNYASVFCCLWNNVLRFSLLKLF
jgi:hypothetical protein